MNLPSARIVFLFATIYLLVGLSAVFADTVSLTASQDAQVSSVSPNNTYGSNSSMGLGYSSTNATHLRSLMQFNLPANLSGATVTSATLQLTGINSPLSFTMTARAARLTSSWSESVTWNSQPAFDTLGSANQTLSASSGTNTYSWNATTMVQAWANGTANNGIIVKQDSEGTTNRYFALNARENAGLKPTLTITYTPANGAPSISGFSGVMRSDGRLDFNYTATDSSGLGYVGVYIVNSDQSVNGAFTLASQADYTTGLASGSAKSVQPWTASQLQGWLTPGTQYCLRMKAQDALGADSGWVYSSAFTYTPANGAPSISGFSGVMRSDGRLDFNYTATDSSGLGYVGVYIVNGDQSVNGSFTVASQVDYTTGLASGSAKSVQPWTASQLQGWLTPGTQYCLRMKAQDALGADSGWVYSSAFTYTPANGAPSISGFSGVMRSDGRLDFNYTATDSSGLGYVGVYIVNGDQSVNGSFTVASQVDYTTGLASGSAKSVQPWTASQLQGWLTSGSLYRLRMKAQDALGADSGWVYSSAFTYTPANGAPSISGFSGVMRSDGRLDFNYTATDSSGLGYVGVYIVNSDQSVNGAFTLASQADYTTGLASGSAKSVQPWTASQLQGWLTPGTQYCLRMKAQDALGADSGWVYSSAFTYTPANGAPSISGFSGVMRSDGRLDFNYTATDSSGLGYVGVYIVNGDQSVNGSFTVASQVDYTTGLASGSAKSVQPWTASQLQGWLTSGSLYRLRMKAQDALGADSGWVYSSAFTYTPANGAPSISGFSGVMRSDGRLDFNYTATDSSGLGYVGVYIVNSDQSVNGAFTLASQADYTTGLASGSAKSVQPWTASQLQGWLTPGTQYCLRMKAQDALGADSGWVYSSAFTYTPANGAPSISGFSGVMRSDGRLDFNYTATDSSGLGYVGVYIVNGDQSVNGSFTVASQVDYTTGLASGSAKSVQPWTASQLQGWLTSGSLYRLRMKAQDALGADSGWVYSPSFAYSATNSAPVVATPLVSLRTDGRLDVTSAAVDADGLGYLGLYLVDESELANSTFSLASKVEINSGLVSGQSQTRQPWSSAQLAGWLMPGTNYRVRIRYQDSRAMDSGWFYSAPFAYSPSANNPPAIATVTATPLSDSSIQVQFTATDDRTASLGIELYISKPGGAGNPGSYDPNSKRVMNSTHGFGATYTYSAADVAKFCIPGEPYTIRLRAFDQDGAMGEGFSTPINAPGSGAVFESDIFSFPIGNRKVYTLGDDGDGWYTSQSFGNWNAEFAGYHLGEDWNKETKGDTDFGEPVFSVGDGVVQIAQSYAVWGKIVTIRHTLSDGKQVESFYAHLDRLDVTPGQSVARGEQIGTIGDGDGAQRFSHLHLELREDTGSGLPGIDDGYSNTIRPTGWLSPSDFIRARLPSPTGVSYVLHRVSDTSGLPNSANPGQTKVLFAPGETVRVTFKATNTGSATPLYALCNARNGSTEATVYRSPKGDETGSNSAIGGAVAVVHAQSLGTGQTAYFSFDVTTSGYAGGSYDISGNLWAAKSGPQLDTTADGVGNYLDETWWKNDRFLIQSSPDHRIFGVDVSKHNGTIDWRSLASEGVRFAWVRSSLGVGIPDEKYATNVTGAKSAGVVYGAYHFAYPAINGALAEAAYFVKMAKSQIGPGFLPPALDIEDQNNVALTSSLSTAALTDWVLAFCREVQRLTGVRPIVYMNRNFASNQVDSRAGEFGLWEADHGPNDGKFVDGRSPAPGVWANWTVWQFTSRATMSGNGSTYIDRNCFGGDETAFLAFIGGGSDAPAAPLLAYPGAASAPGTALTLLTPRFTWRAVSGATGYEILVRNAISNDEVYLNASVGNAAVFDIPSGYLVKGQPYEWVMRAKKGEVWSVNSAARYFTIGELPVLPARPVLLSPVGASAPGPVVPDLTPVMRWKPITGSTQMGLYVRDSLSGELIYVNERIEAAVSFQIPSGTLASGGVYQWNLRAFNAAGWGAFSAVGYFSTPRQGTAPRAPMLLSPGKSASPYPVVSGLSPALTWSEVFAAQRYSVHITEADKSIAVHEDFDLPVGTSYLVPEGILLPGHTYIWNVRVQVGGSWSDYSKRLGFQTPADFSAPAITSLPMGQLTGSNSAQKLIVEGTNFRSGASLLISSSGMAERLLAASRVKVESSVRLLASITTGTVEDTWVIKVRNRDGKVSNPMSLSILGVAETLPVPTISPSGGTRTAPVSVSINHPDASAAIYYTIDGKVPDRTSKLYTGPILLGAERVGVRARAFKEGAKPSGTAVQSYVFNLPRQNPGATVMDRSSVPGGLYFTIPISSNLAAVTVATAGGTGDCSMFIGFGRLPSETDYDRDSRRAGNSETVTIVHPSTGNLYVLLTGEPDFSGLSIAVSATSAVGRAVKPIFSHSGGQQRGPIEKLVITTPDQDAALYYTLDQAASDPTEQNAASMLSGDALRISTSTRVRVRSYVSGKLPSAVADETFTIPETADPSFNFAFDEENLVPDPNDADLKRTSSLKFDIRTPSGVDDLHRFSFIVPSDGVINGSNHRVMFPVALRLRLEGEANSVEVYIREGVSPTTAAYDYRLKALPVEGGISRNSINLGKATPKSRGIRLDRAILTPGRPYYGLVVAKGRSGNLGGEVQLPYQLRLRADLLFAELSTPGGGTAITAATRDTWVAVHGRADLLRRSGSSMREVANNLRFLPEAKKGQVLLLDWSVMSRDYDPPDPLLLSGSMFAPAVAMRSMEVLQAARIPRGELSVIGHSWGTFVAYHMGLKTDKLKRLVALDPAALGDGVNLQTLRFNDVSTRSWAIVATSGRIGIGGLELQNGLYGSPTLAATAAEAFVLRDKGLDTLRQLHLHEAPVRFFAHTLERNYVPPLASDGISDYFRIEQLDLQLDASPGVIQWLRDSRTFSDLKKFEAEIAADFSFGSGIITSEAMELRFTDKEGANRVVHQVPTLP